MLEFLKAELYSEIQKQRGFDSSYYWDTFLKNIELSTITFDCQHLDSAVSVRALAPDDRSNFIDEFTKCRFFWLFAPVHEYKEINPEIDVFWGAEVIKIAGYRCLFHWIGSDGKDPKNFFWANLFSADIREVNMICGRLLQRWVDAPIEERTYEFTRMYRPQIDNNGRDEKVYPPPHIYYQLHSNSQLSLPETDPQNLKTIGNGYLHIKPKLLAQSKYQIGQRIELLDTLVSTRVRPARVKKVCGRRIWVQVQPEECAAKDPDDRQYGNDSYFWVDEDSFLIFPVGWAESNGYQIAANAEYRRHTKKIFDALLFGENPDYDTVDTRPEQMSNYGKGSTVEWEKGMKLELLDPLGASMSELQVASVLDIKQDGYLIIGIDGPDTEEDSFPLHCTSSFIFPVGYAEAHGIPFKTPEGERKFTWKKYLHKKEATAAPAHLFKKDPSPERVALFKIGAKLEACDMCDNHMICPATIVGIKGRLLHVHFDGWGDSYDQLFDIDSKDLLPLGWCEVHAYKLQIPKSDDD